ncbi:interleukin 12 receptor, beta 2a, like isoform 2-T2 [Odontesthes bonariensis]|uniref:interleukin 12 receptor, beta 2a, like isoform X2 n=1 Tax=Odontesthes bonariensis TaxID=219752 RepID=UPI003F58E28A
MAMPMTRWLIPMLVVTLSHCCAAAGPPSPPSRPMCHRPCDEKVCSVIKCTWEPRPDPKIPINYHLQWEPANSEDGHMTSGNSSDGFIHHFPSHGELRVWVQAWNQHGSVNSQDIVFNTEDIIMPPPPTFSSSYQDHLEVHWGTICDELQLTVGTCEVRYRTEEHQDWVWYEDKLCDTYAVSDPQPGTVYEFQVCCACGSSLKSNWSVIHRIRSAESAPVGEVDVWRDCSIHPSRYDCFLTWKNLSISQARGLILGYEVTVFYNNGTVKVVNVSAVEPSTLSVYDEMMWRLTSSLKDVSSVSVSAYNALGSTDATHLVLPAPGEAGNHQPIDLEMQEENLTVSWNSPAQFSDNLKQYVVQFKDCLSGQGFDWIKVDSNKTTALFKGAFKKHTSYQVSLFAVSNNNEVHRLSTATGYSVQGVPSTVLSFQVFSYTDTEAILFWKPFPCSGQNGRILYYQIGVNSQKVYNISGTPHHGNKTFRLQDLNPGQDYEVWIRAVTAAGPGEISTKTFKTLRQKKFDLIPVFVVIGLLLLMISLALILFCVCQGESKVCPQCIYEKVPDPSNSHIFKQMKHQINEPLSWICNSVHEPHPKISMLEVVETKSRAFEPDGLTRLVMKDECSRTDSQEDLREDPAAEECDRTDRRYGRKEYSKMVDSDEEKVDCWSSSEEEQCTSGYEKHFMPSPLEILAD